RFLAAADGPSVERALSNLVDNAMRLSPPGGVVDVVVGEHGGRAFVAVEDDGPGISPEDVPHLFERYWRRGSDQAPGHGIGLALVAQVAAAHDGVEVESPAGERSTRFTLWFRR
ncbi:MAG: ATP-binding protein, partial [Nocardioides sp.]